MLQWLRSLFLKKDVARLKTPSKIEQIGDAYLEDAMREHAQSMALARRMQKANLLKAQAREVQEAALDTEDPFDEDDDEDDEEDTDEGVEKFIKDIIMKKVTPAQQPQTSQQGFAATPAPVSPYKQQVIEQVMKASDEQLRKFLG